MNSIYEPSKDINTNRGYEQSVYLYQIAEEITKIRLLIENQFGEQACLVPVYAEPKEES